MICLVKFSNTELWYICYGDTCKKTEREGQ